MGANQLGCVAEFECASVRFTRCNPGLVAGTFSVNDPVNFIDPDGTNPWLALAVAAGVFYATDLETPGAAQDEMIGVPLAVTGAKGLGKGKDICEQGAAIANANRYLRIGVGRNGGRKSLRASGQFIEWLEKRKFPGVNNGHIDFLDLGPL